MCCARVMCGGWDFDGGLLWLMRFFLGLLSFVAVLLGLAFLFPPTFGGCELVVCAVGGWGGLGLGL